MELHDVFAGLLRTTLAASAAILLVLAINGALRRRFGARVAYAAWWLVPVSMCAVLLPARVVQVDARDLALAVVGTTRATTGLASPGSIDALSLALAGWLIGALACALWAVALQRRFVHRLGRVAARADGMLQAECSLGLPAVVGLRARIVLPADFDARYSSEQRALIVAHERVHVARGDVLCNGIAVFLRCVYWFNPLLWIAEDRFRRDQELACDEAVVARHPRARRAYGEAMMKTQLSVLPAPLACHWSVHHPLKERILMLTQPVPSLRRAAAGALVVALLACCAGAIAWAAQPPAYVADASKYTNAPAANHPIMIVADNRPVRQVALEAARLADVKIDNPEALPLDKTMTLDFKSINISTFMKIIADESGLVVGWTGNHVRFLPKNGSSAVRASASDVKPIDVPAPAYPAAATTARRSGKVLLRLLVATDGSVKDARVVESTPAGVFDAPSLAAARQWKFDPAKKDGKAIESWIEVPITFDNEQRDGQGSSHPLQRSIANATAYDWIRVDPREQANLRTMACDATQVDDTSDPTKPVYWCGNRKRDAIASQ